MKEISYPLHQKQNILNCFSGDHSIDKEFSLICPGGGKADSFPTYLPHNRAIELNKPDSAALQAIIDYRLSRDAAYKKRKLKNKKLMLCTSHVEN